MLPSFEPPISVSNSVRCPHCGVEVVPKWLPVLSAVKPDQRVSDFAAASINRRTFGLEDFAEFEDGKTACLSRCPHCGKLSVWLDGKLAFPISSGIRPTKHMPPEIRKPFEEAQSISLASPWAACTLLRICLERLCDHLGAPRGTLFHRIESLNLLPSEKAIWTVIRKVGNDAAHEGLFPYDQDLGTSENVAEALSTLLNMIVERSIGAKAESERLIRMFDTAKGKN